MPLIQSKSKKAFKSNVKEELSSGKPLAQSLAIGYSVKRHNRKKMAEGGKVNESAKTEHRPMPDERDKDSKNISQNSGNKSPVQDSWTSRPDKMSLKGRTYSLKSPKMVPSSVMNTKLRDDELDLQSSTPAGTPGEQPGQWMDEKGANRQGPESRDLKLKKMAKGGMLEDPDHSGNLHNKQVDSEYGDGSEEDRQEEPSGLMEDDDQMRPSKEKYMSGEMEMLAEGGDPATEEMVSRPDKGWGAIIVKPNHNDTMMAEGGSVEEEEAIEHAASIAAAIMSKRKAMSQDSGSTDDDHAVQMAEGGRLHSGSPDEDRAAMYAEGGMVDLDLNSMEQPNAYYNRNENDLLKENYDEDMHDVTEPSDSNEHGDSREDDSENKHDNSIVSRIRSKMRMRSPISR